MQKTLQKANKHYPKSYQTLANSLEADQQETIKQITQIGFQIFGKNPNGQVQQDIFEIQGFEKVIGLKKDHKQLTGRKNFPIKNQITYQNSTKSQRKNQKKKIECLVQQDQWISLYDFLPNNPEVDLFGQQDQQANKQRKKIEIYCINDRNFSKPIKNFKKKFIDSLPKQSEQERQFQYIRSNRKKSTVSLDQFYEQNKPLYDRFVQIKQKRQSKILKAHLEQIQHEMKDVTFVPKLIKNNYYQNLPDFQTRKAKESKIKAINKVKIEIQTMQNYTFYPKTNRTNVSSKIKDVWTKNRNREQKMSHSKEYSSKKGNYFPQILQENQISENQQYKHEYIYQEFPIMIKDPKSELSFMISDNGSGLFSK